MGRTRRVKLGKHLAIKSSYLAAIFRGDKMTTIRKGIITPTQSRVFLHSGGRIVAEVEIVSVRYLKVKDLTDEDAKKDGFSNKEELLQHLLKHYPDLKPDDWITILKFRLVRVFKDSEGREDKFYYKGLTPVQIAKLALAYNLVQNADERRILALVLTRGSIREAAQALGGLHKRPLIRKVLREAVKRLEEKGIIKEGESSS